MTDQNICKLKKWIEKKYGERALVLKWEKHSLTVDKSFIKTTGIGVYTDGIMEINMKDDFSNVVISGFDCTMLCFSGAEYSESNEPRIVVYCGNDSMPLRKYKRYIRKILNKY